MCGINYGDRGQAGQMSVQPERLSERAPFGEMRQSSLLCKGEEGNPKRFPRHMDVVSRVYQSSKVIEISWVYLAIWADKYTDHGDINA